jgi:asparagine synthase (glutamine-hydrolysing)
MCGFCWSTPNNDTAFVEQAVNTLRHRGPDEQSITLTPLGALGHARLSIVDVRASHQPMEDGRHWIVFNGEIYNFQTLRAQLDRSWVMHGDTQVVMSLIVERGIEAIDSLDGMFAFAFSGNEGLLARDAIGLKPLCYT